MIEKEKFKKEKEKIPLKEKLFARFGAWLPKFKEIVGEFFNKPVENINNEGDVFEEGFGNEDYNNLYYPEIKGDEFEHVSELIASLEKIDEKTGIKQINGDKLKKTLEHLFQGQEGVAELVENYCIYDFIIRLAIKKMLEIRPDDHFNTLDVGGGPTVYQHIPLAPISANITHSEYLASARQAVEDFKIGKEGGHDWTSYFECVKNALQNKSIYSAALPEVQSQIEKISQSSNNEFSDLLRGKIEKVIPVDVFDPNLKLQEQDEEFDMVNVGKWGSVDLLTSHFCIESATADPEKWKAGVKNIGSKVASGGFLLMTAIRNAEWYKVGENQMPAVPVDAVDINTELEKNGFKILEERELLNKEQKEAVGYDGMVFVLAQKIDK